MSQGLKLNIQAAQRNPKWAYCTKSVCLKISTALGTPICQSENIEGRVVLRELKSRVFMQNI